MITQFYLKLILLFKLNLSSGLSFPTAHNNKESTIRQNSNSRRDFFHKALTVGSYVTSGTILSNVLLYPKAALAISSSLPTEKELEKLQLGHARIKYMLDHWDDVTKICGTSIMSDTERKQVIRTEGGGGTDSCNKNPLRVQEFMGYKSTNDPLYKADKLMIRAGPLVDSDKFDAYFDAVERYSEKADSTALLAYTSSWGEANP